MSLEYEPSSKPLHIYVKQLFLKVITVLDTSCSVNRVLDALFATLHHCKNC